MNREKVATRLRHLSTEKPTTKMGQVRWVWADIRAALDAGHTLQVIHKRLNESGIEIGYRTLSLYIGRLEREQAAIQTHEPTAGGRLRKVQTVDLPKSAGHDPFANIRLERARKKSAGFEYDAFSTNKNLLE